MLLRQGRYVESVAVSNLRGTGTRKIVVGHFENDQVIIDAAPAQFRQPHGRWQHGGNGEYVCPEKFLAAGRDLESTRVSHGAFVRTDPHTGLVTYSQRKDLHCKHGDLL